MNHACPKCGTSLERRWVPSLNLPEGTPFYLAAETTLACPACRVPIRRNANLGVRGFGVVAGLGVLFYAGAMAFDSSGIWPVIAALVFIGALAASQWYERRYLRDWPVWVRNDRVS